MPGVGGLLLVDRAGGEVSILSNPPNGNVPRQIFPVPDRRRKCRRCEETNLRHHAEDAGEVHRRRVIHQHATAVEAVAVRLLSQEALPGDEPGEVFVLVSNIASLAGHGVG